MARGLCIIRVNLTQVESQFEELFSYFATSVNLLVENNTLSIKVTFLITYDTSLKICEK